MEVRFPTDSLDTIEPELKNITRLFGLPESNWDMPPRYTWQEEERGGLFVCTCAMDDTSVTREAPVPAMTGDDRVDALHLRRTARRLCKQTMYDLCRQVTGIRPPWGSMSGIRPTRLMYECLERGMTPDEAVAALERDFDTTPEKAALLRQIVAVQQRLPKPGDQFADVYIGIPFCTTRCTYCSFSSGEIGTGKLVEPYLNALMGEMEATARLLTESGRTLRALYIGGGTPTSLNEDQFARLMEHTMTLFPGACEYTVEAGRPDTITMGKLNTIRRSGVTRISINPQTMSDRTLQVIGRAHTAAQVEEAYDMAREAGIGHINMDVIAGLPGETTEDFAHTMAGAVRLHPESLTVHTLAIKRSSRMALTNAPLPDGSMTAEMVRMGFDTARQLGMEPYYLYRQKYMAGNLENVGYALPGHACLYNVDIMEENTNILAIGAGGISKRVFTDEGHIGRAPNVSNIEHYIARVDEMIARKRELFLTEQPVGGEADSDE